MRLIDYTYFQYLPTLIPVNDVDGDVGAAQISYINSLIDVEQPKVLKQIMGATLYDEFIEGLGETIVESKWTDILNKIRNSSNKTSFLTYFVYIQDRIMSNSIASQHGDVSVDVINAQKSQDFAKNATIWNSGATLANEFSEWLWENADTYDVWTVGTIKLVNRFDI